MELYTSYLALLDHIIKGGYQTTASLKSNISASRKCHKAVMLQPASWGCTQYVRYQHFFDTLQMLAKHVQNMKITHMPPHAIPRSVSMLN
jgi:hypothetical protein